MRLQTLRIDRAPGIPAGYEVTGLDAINVIHGPNGSGKSTLVRALRAILWPPGERNRGASRDAVEASATFSVGDRTLLALHRGGTTEWQENGRRIDAPPLPPPELASCFTPSLVELLRAEDVDDLAGLIARELAGGFDLEALSQRFRVPSRKGDPEFAALRSTSEKVREIQEKHRASAQAEAGLPTMRGELETLRRRSAEAPPLQRALDLFAEQERLAESEARFAALPAGLDRLQGDEPDALKRIRDQREAHERQEQAQTALMARLSDERQSLGLTGESIDGVTLAECEERVNRLVEAEQEVAKQRRQVASLRSAHEKASAGLDPEAVLEPAVLDGLDDFLVRSDALRARRSQLDQELRIVANERAKLGEDAADPQRLREAAAALRRWLGAPPTQVAGPHRTLAISSGVALLVAGVILTVAVHPAWIVLALLGGAAVGASVLLSRTSVDPRAHWVAEFERTGVGSLSWEASEVEKALAQLEGRISAAEARRPLKERQARLDEASRDVEKEASALAMKREELSRAVSLEGSALDGSTLSLAVLARRVAAANESARQLVESEALLGSYEATVGRLLDEVTTSFAAFRLEPPRDGTSARHRLRDLKGRFDRFRELSAELRRAQDAVENATREIHRLDEEERGIWERIGLEPGSFEELRFRRSKLSEHSELAADIRTRRELVRVHAEAVKALGEGIPKNAVEAEERLAAAKGAADQASALESAIAKLETTIAQLRGGVELQQARAKQAEAEEALLSARSESLDLEAASFLVDSLREEYEETSRPPVLRRADTYFTTFTRNAFGLLLDRDGQFRGVNRATTEGLPLTALSDGTRLQLLLAVKLAFAAEQRASGNVPFILDEALGNTDPVRFSAIVDGLVALSQREGWQVFHFTSQPADVLAWAQRTEAAGGARATVIDLAEVRRLSTAAPAAIFEPPPARPSVPSPEGYSAAAYAEVLGVPALDPFAGVDAQHVFHLLEDQLPLVHRLLDLGISTVGSLRSLAASGGAPGLVDTSEIEARRSVMEAFFNAWKIGRGKKVPKHVLSEAGVSDAFLESVEALVDRHDGDARAIIASLEAREVSRFRTQSIHEMKEWFEENGYLSSTSPLDSDSLRQAVSRAVSQVIPTLMTSEGWGASRIFAEVERLDHRLALQASVETEVSRAS